MSDEPQAPVTPTQTAAPAPEQAQGQVPASAPEQPEQPSQGSNLLSAFAQSNEPAPEQPAQEQPAPTPEAQPEQQSGDFRLPWFNEDGTPNADMIQSMPDGQLKKLAMKYQTPEDFAKGLDHLAFMATGKGLQALPPDATDEQRERWNMQMREVNGVPETPEGYEVKKPENLPENVWWPEGVEDNYKEWAHQNNVSPKAMQELIETHAKVLNGVPTAQQQLEQLGDSLFSTISEIAPGKEQEFMDTAAQGLKRAGVEMNLEDMSTPSLMTALVKVANKYASATSEEQTLSAAQEGVASEETMKTPEQEFQEMLNNPAHDWHAAWHSKDPEMQKRASEWAKRLFANQKGR